MQHSLTPTSETGVASYDIPCAALLSVAGFSSFLALFLAQQ